MGMNPELWGRKTVRGRLSSARISISFCWLGIGWGKDRYLGDAKQGYIKDYRPLAVFFAEVIERGRVTP